jgi:phosphatidylserine decarboxylase
MDHLIPLESEIFNPYFLLVLLSGIYISIKLKFPQIRYFFLAIKILSGTLDHKGSKGQLIHSQSFFAGTGSSLLFGSTIGSIFALSIGGVGALFWIWVITLLTMPLRVVSSTMAIRFRNILPNGRHLSGPMYFIEKALKAKWLAIGFAISSLFVVLTLGGLVPILSMNYVTSKSVGLRGMDLTLLICAGLIFVVLGGIRRVGKTAGILMPIGMILFFIFYFIKFHDSLLPFVSFIEIVFNNIFSIKSTVVGGTLGILTGLGESVGVFFISTETGVGKSAGISGVVRTDSPIKQGLVSMLSSFFEGFIVSTLVFYLLYSNGVTSSEKQLVFLNDLLQTSSFSTLMLVISFLIFGFVGMCGWFYMGEQSAYYIMGEKFANFFRILFIAALILSSYFFWKLGDQVIIMSYNAGYTLAVLTAIPVLISLLLLAKSVSSEMQRYISEGGIEYEVFKDFYLLLLTILPKNFISQLFGLFTHLQLPRFILIPLLKAFAKMYKINLNEAELNISEYKSLNLFFTRALKAGVRIINSEENAVVSPVDAKITSFGDIQESTMIQAKGIDYSLKELIGSDKYLSAFESGKFITFYLSPQDYHRIHSPFYGKILGYYYEPGKLFPVNEMAVKGIKSLFPKNERLITFMQTEYGKIAVVKVGASNVGRIRVTYDNKIVTNSLIRIPKEVEYTNVNILINKGAELGRFEMGSTVILIFEKGSFDFCELPLTDKQTYGTTIGHFKQKVMQLPK